MAEYFETPLQKEMLTSPREAVSENVINKLTETLISRKMERKRQIHIMSLIVIL